MTTFGNEEELTVLPHFITLRGSTRAPEHGCPACAPGSSNSTAVPVNPRDSPRTCGGMERAVVHHGPPSRPERGASAEGTPGVLGRLHTGQERFSSFGISSAVADIRLQVDRLCQQKPDVGLCKRNAKNGQCLR